MLANARLPARSTCTACHQRKVKCDAHDRGYPCTRCRKNGNESDCRLHKKNKRVSRAKQQARRQSTHDGKPLSPAPPLVAASQQQSPIQSSPAAPIHESIVAVAPTPTPPTAATPGSLFLQTVIADGGGDNIHVVEPSFTAPQELVDTTPQTPRDRVEHNDRFDNDHIPHSDSGTAGSTTTTTASTPAVLPSHGADGEYKKYLVEFIDQPQLAERPIDKKARILYVGSSLSNIHFLLRQRMSASVSGASPKKETSEAKEASAARKETSEARRKEKEETAVHYPTNHIAKPSAGLGALAADGLPLEAFQLPPKRTVDQLLAAYLQHINPGFPVVDRRLFMRQYRARDPANPPSLLLLQAMLVAGAHVLYKDDPDTRHAQKAVFFRRAKMLLDARVERNRDTVVQAALLLTWHADGPEDVAANAWHWVGLAARTATGLGMHRDADGSTLVPHNKRMWRRVWWLLVACDVLVALQYGRPPALHLDDTDVAPLTANDFVDCGSGTRVDYVLHLVQLCILLSTHVLRRQFRSTLSSSSSKEKDRQSTLRRTDEALANWSLHLPPSLHLTGQGNPSSTSATSASTSINVWTASLHLTYNTALLLLHRQAPSPHAALDNKTGGPSPDDVEICTNAAVAIQQIFHAVCASGQAVYLWSSAINSLFTALIQLSGDVQRSTSASSTAVKSSKSHSRGNPLLAVAALRRYDAALASLRQLAAYWPNAQAVVQFFEQSVRTGVPSASAATTNGDASAMSEDTSNTTTTIDNTRQATPVPDQNLPEMTESATVTKDFASYPPVGHAPVDMHVEMEMDTVDSRLSHSSQVYDDHHMSDQHVSPHDPSDPDMAQHLLSSFVAASRPMLPFEGHHHHHHGHTPPMADPWSAPVNTDWQRIYWQQPELTDDFLFSF